MNNNAADLTFVKIERQELETLSTEQALELVINEPKVIDFLKTKEITDVNLDLESGRDGIIYIKTQKINQVFAQESTV